MPACSSAIAMPIPPNPAPMIATRYGMDPPSQLLPGYIISPVNGSRTVFSSV